MRTRHLTSIVLAASLVSAQAFGAAAGDAVANPHAAPAQPAPKINLSQSNAASDGGQANSHSPSGAVNVRGCNESGSDILVAMVYQEATSQTWRSQGWYRIKNGECRALFDTTVRSFFVRAEEDGGDHAWGHDGYECAAYPGPYDYSLAADATDCPDGAQSVQFTEVPVEKPGAFTYTFQAG